MNNVGHLTVGGLASFSMIMTLQPIDTMKTYLMSGKSIPHPSLFYRETASAIASIVPIHCLTFLFHGIIINQQAEATQRKRNHFQKTCNGIIAALFSSPLATIFQRVTILGQIKNQTPREILPNLTLHLGNRSIFKGYSFTLIRETAFAATLFGISDFFETVIKEKIPDDFNQKDRISSYLGKFFAGALSGALTSPLWETIFSYFCWVRCWLLRRNYNFVKWRLIPR